MYPPCLLSGGRFRGSSHSRRTTSPHRTNMNQPASRNLPIPRSYPSHFLNCSSAFVVYFCIGRRLFDTGCNSTSVPAGIVHFSRKSGLYGGKLTAICGFRSLSLPVQECCMSEVYIGVLEFAIAVSLFLFGPHGRQRSCSQSRMDWAETFSRRASVSCEMPSRFRSALICFGLIRTPLPVCLEPLPSNRRRVPLPES